MTGRSSSVTIVIEVPPPADEAAHGIADLVGPLLLGPVAAAAEQDRLAQPRRDLAQPRQHLSHAGPADDEIPVPRDEQSGNGDRRVVPGCGELPVAVDVAVPVERPGEAGVPVFRYESLYVLAGQPAGQAGGARRLRAGVEESPARRDDRRPAGPVAGSRVQQPGEGLARIRGRAGLGRPPPRATG